ncbi:hypothetical protein [Radiobacillus sp. PE A8.2]|uniref:hypothetical protein n=1 Tax=Radiobacillus sp. PE A8.2 TaxID=3380349 RepID=UPI00388D5F1E
MKTDVNDLKTEMHNRFGTIEGKLEGIGGHFELTNESRLVDLANFSSILNVKIK